MSEDRPPLWHNWDAQLTQILGILRDEPGLSYRGLLAKLTGDTPDLNITQKFAKWLRNRTIDRTPALVRRVDKAGATTRTAALSLLPEGEKYLRGGVDAPPPIPRRKPRRRSGFFMSR